MVMKIQNLLILAAASALITSASAATTTMEWVTVGNPGNAADPTTGYGAVSYAYNIGKYEVTNAQYVEFLNAKGQSNSNGIYNAEMVFYGITQSGTSGSFTYTVTGELANKPVVYVSWYDAARFANWLLNGKGSGNMEDGAYTLNGATSGIIPVNSLAQIYLPSEDEWYKAAYYQGNGTYSLYPNGQNTITTADANYNFLVGASTNVGTYAAKSFYGTFDQGGNVSEWNDVVIDGSFRGLRGGNWLFSESSLRASARNYLDPTSEASIVGFRVASSSIAAVPEPSGLLTTAALIASGLLLRRRSRNSL
jgi:formylglycine-generating enzyme